MSFPFFFFEKKGKIFFHFFYFENMKKCTSVYQLLPIIEIETINEKKIYTLHIRNF